MLLATKALGSVELSTTEVFHFPDGLVGFPEEKEFALVQENKDSPFLWLQSTSKVSLAFVVIEPSYFYKMAYKLEVLASDLESLSAQSVDECSIYVTVTIPKERPEEMTANLQGPILFHRRGKKGRQVISLNDEHKVRVPILKQLEN